MLDSAKAERQKSLGAFYTPPEMAKVLTDWAVQSPQAHVLDPSCVGQVFLWAANSRLRELGASRSGSRRQVFGVDLDSEAHRDAVQTASHETPARQNLIEGVFFSLPPAELPSFDAVVGNPPYIRYQAFNGSAAPAEALMQTAGLRLTR